MSSGKRFHAGRYHRLAPTSQVDETLFDLHKPPNHSQAREERETIQIISRDLIRTIRVPRKDWTRESTDLPSPEIKRIISESKKSLKQEREAFKQASEKEREANPETAEIRRKQLQAIEQSIEQNPALTDLQLEAQMREQLIVDQANELRMEEEEEVRKLNQLILGAQCQATWDDQIQEKKVIRAEQSEEEKRLDNMMEMERRKALEIIKKIDELRREQKIIGHQQVYNQIQERMEEKQNLIMMKEAEKDQINKEHERKMLEELQAQEQKRKEQQLLQEEIKRVNAEVLRAKEKQLEEEKLADKRAAEYLEQKLKREEEYEAEQKRLKKEKEMDIARLKDMQEKERDIKAEQDEKRARRNQEFADRQWRMKQRELAAKKAREEANLKAARLEQIKNKEHNLSMEQRREEAALERILKSQQEAVAKEKELKERQLQETLHHAETLRHQIKLQELSALNMHREKFQEANRLMEAERQRRLRLTEVKEKKLKELKATGIPEKYCSGLERKIRKTVKDLDTAKI
ncbi:cilia- and flagella-associated protein 45 [Cyprinodon tularosa]|uniref:cilia- and flagella-associated protein 45 n=1 Tax=Cyprinodon tularosa TaxID=77115 RepID=UPI0018E26F86|nr:cilia- and flagella-associated protein 45 [Cyprinodon tularosa]